MNGKRTIHASFVPCTYRPCQSELGARYPYGVQELEEPLHNVKSIAEIVSERIDSQEPQFYAPFLVQWEITQQCNLSCLHCYAGSGKALEGELDSKEALRLIDVFSNCGVETLHLLGGEPFSRHDVLLLIQHAVEKGLNLHINSNGTLIDDAIVGNLPKDITIDISLDGCPETHEYLRGSKDCYSKAIEAVTLLDCSGISTGLCFTANRKNYKQIDHILKTASKLVDRLQILALSPVGRGAGVYDDLHLENKEMIELTEKIRGAIPSSRHLYIDAPALGLSCNSDQQFALIKDGAFNKGQEIQYGCAAGISKCAVSCTGDVFPCLLHRVGFGNIKVTEFFEIWTWLHEYCKRSKNCKDGLCKYSEICGGHCRTNTETVVGR